MANQEQLDRLLRSVDEWNQWREQNPDAVIDLAGARLSAYLIGDGARLDLSGVNLAGVNLAVVDLSGANLERADLSNADLRRANLAHTNLIGTKLDGADLRYARFDRAILRDLDLRTTELWGAMLLEDASLTNVQISDEQKEMLRRFGIRIHIHIDD